MSKKSRRRLVLVYDVEVGIYNDTKAMAQVAKFGLTAYGKNIRQASSRLKEAITFDVKRAAKQTSIGKYLNDFGIKWYWADELPKKLSLSSRHEFSVIVYENE